MRISWRLTAVVLLAAVWPQLGCVQLPAGKSMQQMQPLDQNLNAAPKQEPTAQSFQNQASGLEQAGKIKEAIAIYEQMRQGAGPQAWETTRKIAQLYDRINDLEGAEQEYRLLLQQNSKDAGILCSLGNIYYRRGQWYAADKFFRDAVYHQPEYAAAWAGLGWTLAQQGQHDDAIEALAKVGSKAEAYRVVANVLNLQGKREDALRALQAAVTIEPSNMQIRAELAQVQMSAPVTPQTVARVAPPVSREQRGHVDLEEAPSIASANDGTNRLMQQRPTLPPLPDLDLAAGTGHEWECSPRNGGKN